MPHLMVCPTCGSALLSIDRARSPLWRMTMICSGPCKRAWVVEVPEATNAVEVNYPKHLDAEKLT